MIIMPHTATIIMAQPLARAMTYISNNANSNSHSYFSTSSYTYPHSSSSVWVGSCNFQPNELEVYYEAIA